MTDKAALADKKTFWARLDESSFFNLTTFPPIFSVERLPATVVPSKDESALSFRSRLHESFMAAADRADEVEYSGGALFHRAWKTLVLMLLSIPFVAGVLAFGLIYAMATCFKSPVTLDDCTIFLLLLFTLPFMPLIVLFIMIQPLVSNRGIVRDEVSKMRRTLSSMNLSAPLDVSDLRAFLAVSESFSKIDSALADDTRLLLNSPALSKSAHLSLLAFDVLLHDSGVIPKESLSAVSFPLFPVDDHWIPLLPDYDPKRAPYFEASSSLAWWFASPRNGQDDLAHAFYSIDKPAFSWRENKLRELSFFKECLRFIGEKKSLIDNFAGLFVQDGHFLLFFSPASGGPDPNLDEDLRFILNEWAQFLFSPFFRDCMVGKTVCGRGIPAYIQKVFDPIIVSSRISLERDEFDAVAVEAVGRGRRRL